MTDQAEKLAMFKSVAGTDDDGFALPFLEAHGWNVEAAVNSLMGGGPSPSGGAGSSAAAAPPPPQEAADPLLDRAPMNQYRDTLVDPAQRMPTTPAPPVTHHLEAFRDAKTDAETRDDTDSTKPKTLADIYRPPTEMCFQGNFDQLREAGRKQGKWLLVNIQSPTEFASQQLNADTWRDETLRLIVSASYLFWQQYYDREDGAKYCRYYNVHAHPHIGLIDPVTGQLIKSWTGFKDAERLMDKLTEMADTPPTDGFAAMEAEPPPVAPLASAPPSGGHHEEEEDIAAAIAASLGNVEDAVMPPAPAPEPEPAWPDPPGEPAPGTADAITLRVRLPEGAQLTRAFLPSHTLQDVLCSVHHSGQYAVSQRKVYQLATMGFPPVTDPATTLGSIGLSGRVMVNLTERV